MFCADTLFASETKNEEDEDEEVMDVDQREPESDQPDSSMKLTSACDSL